MLATNVFAITGRTLQKRKSEIDIATCCKALYVFAKMDIRDDRVLNVLTAYLETVRQSERISGTNLERYLFAKKALKL